MYTYNFKTMISCLKVKEMQCNEIVFPIDITIFEKYWIMFFLILLCFLYEKMITLFFDCSIGN